MPLSTQPYVRHLERNLDAIFRQGRGLSPSQARQVVEDANARFNPQGNLARYEYAPTAEAIEGLINRYQSGALTDAAKGELRRAAQDFFEGDSKNWALADAERDALQFRGAGAALFAASGGVPADSSRAKVLLPSVAGAQRLAPVYVRADDVMRFVNERLAAAQDPETAAQMATFIGVLIENSQRFDMMMKNSPGLAYRFGTAVVDSLGQNVNVVLDETERTKLASARAEIARTYGRYQAFRSERDGVFTQPDGKVVDGSFFRGNILKDLLVNDIGKHGYPTLPEAMTKAIASALEARGVAPELDVFAIYWLMNTTPSQNPERAENVRTLIAGQMNDVPVLGAVLAPKTVEVLQLWLEQPQLFAEGPGAPGVG